MSEVALSRLQTEQAVGELDMAFRAETDAVIEVSDMPQAPNFTGVKNNFSGLESAQINEGQGLVFVEKPREQDLRNISAARAVAGFSARKQGKEYLAFSPCIVLSGGRIGLLTTVVDVKDSLKPALNITEMQQRLLAALFVREQEGVGVSHEQGVAEVGHATLIAISSDPRTIHETTHNYADNKAFGKSVAAQTAIRNGHSERPTDSIAVPASSVASLVFTEDMQVPLSANSRFEASAGVALAAKKTHGGQFDLKRNVGAMAQQMGGK